MATNKEPAAKSGVIHFSEEFVPAETFEAVVTIPVLGKEPKKVSMTFETLEPDEYLAKVKADVPLIEFLGQRIKGWDEEVMGVPYSAKAFEAICRRNNAFSTSVLDAYQRALITGRVGN